MSRKSKAAELSNEGYNISVVGRNVMVTDSMKDYAIEKVSKIEKFSHRIIDVIVTMDIQKLVHRVDIVISVDHIKIKSQATSDDMYASIDKATDKIERQLLRYKTKIQDHHAKGLNVIDMQVNVIKKPEEEELEDVNIEIEDESRRQLVESFQVHEVVANETRPLKMLTLDEAMMKMELSGDTFMIFKAEEDQKIKVIYRRNDENYGVIEVES